MKLYQVVIHRGYYDSYREEVIATVTEREIAEKILSDYNNYITEGYKQDFPINKELFVDERDNFILEPTEDNLSYYDTVYDFYENFIHEYEKYEVGKIEELDVNNEYVFNKKDL